MHRCKVLMDSVVDDSDTKNLLNFIDMATVDILATMSHPTGGRLRNKRKVNHKKYLMKQVKRCRILGGPVSQDFVDDQRKTNDVNAQCQVSGITKVNDDDVCSMLWPSPACHNSYSEFWERIPQPTALQGCQYNQDCAYVANYLQPFANNRSNSVNSPASSSQESFESSVESSDQFKWANVLHNSSKEPQGSHHYDQHDLNEIYTGDCNVDYTPSGISYNSFRHPNGPYDQGTGSHLYPNQMSQNLVTDCNQAHSQWWWPKGDEGDLRTTQLREDARPDPYNFTDCTFQTFPMTDFNSDGNEEMRGYTTYHQ